MNACLEFLLCAGFDVGLFGLNNNTMLIHTISLGHVLVAEKTTIGNVGSVDSGREKEESQDTYKWKSSILLIELLWQMLQLVLIKLLWVKFEHCICIQGHLGVPKQHCTLEIGANTGCSELVYPV